MKDSPTNPDTESPDWLDTHPKAKWLATSRTTGYFSAAVVALVVVLVAIVVVGGRGDDAPTATPPPNSATPSITTAPQTDPGNAGGFRPSIADPFGREISVPINEQGQVLTQNDPGERPAFTAGAPVPAPEGIKWERIGATVAPFSTSDGPTRIEGRLAYGFSRTPQGAALAGWQITARMLRSGDDVREAYERQIVADPGVAEAKLAKLDAEGRSNFRLDRLPIFPEAFQVTSYNTDTAIVRYALPTAGHTTWTLTQQTLTWTDNGWKARLTAAEPTLADITTLAGWTRW
ncbi:hypothetical protein [Rhodococcoides fascians]|uniref:hypothetical protein n=1 Tax=Rhodococcoides fascians TaxID=1828 RepID=UPI00068D827D|nr:hypothetical protein [Rhodococcus fascians]